MVSFFEKKPILKFGIICSFIVTLNEIILYLITRNNPYFTTKKTLLEYTGAWIGLSIPFVMVFIALGYLKQREDACLSHFSEIIKKGLAMGIFTSPVYICYSLIFVYSIQPETLSQILTISKEMMIAKGVKEDSKEMIRGLNTTKNAFIPTIILTPLITNLFISFIAAAIASVFIRRKK